MFMFERNTSSGERLYVFDNVFTSLELNKFEAYAATNPYKRITVLPSNLYSRSGNEEFFGSILSDSDISNFGIFNTKGFNKISPHLNGMSIKRAWILCTDTGTKYTYHTDAGAGGLTMLYYMNSFWHPEWGGETLFCNITGEPEIAVACKPNRVVIFPCNLMHKPSGIARDAATRYTFTATFATNE